MFSADVLIVFICISAGYKCYVMMMSDVVLSLSTGDQ